MLIMSGTINVEDSKNIHGEAKKVLKTLSEDQEYRKFPFIAQ